MRNYVIINGINSLDIQGLAINNLPPITKPMIRTQREEIDGRDGDIVTELGYSAYDKQMEIGLYGNFDIDAIIKYFTGEGTIVFSNEADKYYNFKILDQIDYEKLLKFKTAVVTFHCQPFKYPLEEEPVEAEITTITGTGETITLENVEEAPMKIVYKGNTYQNGEPTPDTPIPIQVVSGDNSIEVSNGDNTQSASYPINLPVENLVGLQDIASTTTDGITYSVSNGEITINGTKGNSGNVDIPLIQNVILKNGTTYTYSGVLSGTLSKNINVNLYDGTNDIISTRQDLLPVTGGSYSGTATTLRLHIPYGDTFTNFKMKLQLEVGTKANHYTPYGTTPIEMCKIGTYQDKIDKSTGKNLFDEEYELGTINFNTGALESSTTIIRTKNYQSIKPSTQYTLKVPNEVTGIILYYYNNGSYIGRVQPTIGSATHTTTFTTNASANQVKWRFNSNYTTLNNQTMLNEGTTALPYEPYGTSWYLKKEIGKVVLNENSNVGVSVSANYSTCYLSDLLDVATTTGSSVGFSNYFKIKYNNAIGNAYFSSGKYLYMIMDTSINNTATFKSWLGNNNVEIYYPLATPTYTLIEGELLNQLEAIKMSYEGQTNLSQINNDLPFELDASVTFLTPMEINNIGNIYAKPILTIEGTGNIGVVLNGIQILEIDLSNNGKITIDVPKLEAYNPDDDTLLNRLVTGDYMKLLINEGENKIILTGEVSGATLKNYIRWI